MTGSDETSPVQIIQHQLEALNAKSLDTFCAPCASSIRVEDANGKLLLSGIAQFRTWYSEHFAANPDFKVDLLDRMSIGEWVIDECLATGYADGSQLHLIIVNRVVDGQVRSLQVLR